MGNGTPFFDCLVYSSLLLERNGLGNCLDYWRCLGVFTDIREDLLRFFRFIDSIFSGHVLDNFSGFIAILFYFINEMLSLFCMLGSGSGTIFCLGLDFPESSKAYIADHYGNNAEDCEDNGNNIEPAVNVRCPVIQKFASKFVEAMLNFDIFRSRNRRAGRKVNLYGCVTLRAFLVVL